MSRKAYPSDVTDDESDFVMPYLTLIALDSPQRSQDLREVSDAFDHGQLFRVVKVL